MSSSLLPLASTVTPFSSPNTQSRAFKTRTNKTHGFRISCNNAQDDHKDNQLILPETQKLVLPNVDRRNLLMGLGGIYTTANLASVPEAISEPIKTPEITLEGKCKTVTTGFASDVKTRPTQCCPPSLTKEIQDFKFPPESIVRIRWPAHKGTSKQVNDYRRAIAAMRALPEDDPHSFVSQAKIHCAYCHGAYTQAGKEIQIHNSWLFFPFHRWYLYFYERILGKLIDDPTFALPYWKWDDPAGMPIPDMFIPKDIDGTSNPLYDEYRESSHLPPEIVDLSWTPGQPVKDLSKKQQEACNLTSVYRELLRTESDTLAFFGGRYGAGDDPIDFGDKTIGSVEAGSHTAIHLWVGSSKQPNNEDMGRFYSAGYDPLFYCHHANVDRMWKIWNDLSSTNVEPADTDWLDASYVFYDENKKLVRVYNRDSNCLKNLKYNYVEDTKIVSPWRTSRPEKRNKATQVVTTGDQVATVDTLKFPVRLDRILKIRVKRPENEENAKEVLVITGIQFDCNKFVKFDVFVNDKVSKGGKIPTACDPEYAGCFAQIPHSDEKKESMRSGIRLGLTELFEDTNTQDEKYAVVALVPRAGCEDLTIGRIRIQKLLGS